MPEVGISGRCMETEVVAKEFEVDGFGLRF